MQDNRAAIIFGEDDTTGGGGANVIEYTKLLSKYDSSDFPPMPYVKELPYSHQDARLSWRQFIRAGPHVGELIEDDGVRSDVRIRPVLSDLLPGSTTNTQLDVILEKLHSEGYKNGNSFVSFDIAPLATHLHIAGQNIEFDLTLYDVSSVTLSDASGTVIQTVTVPHNMLLETTKHHIQFAWRGSIGRNKFTFVGYNWENKAVFTTFRYVLTEDKPAGNVPALNIAAGSTTNLDLSMTKAYCVITNNFRSTPASGWSYQDGYLSLQIFEDYGDAAIVYYLATPSAATKITVSLEFDFDADPQSDYLTISYSDLSGNHDLNHWPSNGGVFTPSYSFIPHGDFQISLQIKSTSALRWMLMDIYSIVIKASQV